MLGVITNQPGVARMWLNIIDHSIAPPSISSVLPTNPWHLPTPTVHLRPSSKRHQTTSEEHHQAREHLCLPLPTKSSGHNWLCRDIRTQSGAILIIFLQQCGNKLKSYLYKLHSFLNHAAFIFHVAEFLKHHADEDKMQRMFCITDQKDCHTKHTNDPTLKNKLQ